MSFRRRLKGESGAATVIEAALIFPIVLIIMGLLIIMGFYSLHRMALYTHAQKIALEASRIVAYPGYEQFGPVSSRSADQAIPFDKEFAPETIKSVMNVHDPYRYWDFNFNEKSKMEQELQRLISEVWYLAPNAPVATVDVKNFVITQKVIVTVKDEIAMPDFMKYIGIDQAMTIDITAVATVSDQAEFVRNTDIVFDFAGFLAKKFHLDDKMSQFMQKVKDTMAKLK